MLNEFLACLLGIIIGSMYGSWLRYQATSARGHMRHGGWFIAHSVTRTLALFVFSYAILRFTTIPFILLVASCMVTTVVFIAYHTR